VSCIVRQFCLDIAIELAIGRIDGVGEIGEPGKGAEAAHDVVKRLILLDGGTDTGIARFGGGIGKLALPLLLEGNSHLAGLFHVSDKFWGRCGRIEIAELPGGQVSERLAGRLACREIDGREINERVERGRAHGRNFLCFYFSDRPIRSVSIRLESPLQGLIFLHRRLNHGRLYIRHND
jgi:hypothetical protein